ncbi:TPA: F0F1 ATP synthase subunit A [Candidatus Nomurabacteria bacterium]|nr:MAG: ATP synthase subunit a [Parcubacteria bacterium RAAC4_OD1_1]HCY26618.1 F0F1 ATP synthase subunit A [Candidatus Nomurabacteria bacterium]
MTTEYETQNTEKNIETHKDVISNEYNLEIETNSSNEEISHEATLYAEPIFHIGNFTVTNALFTSWIVVAILIIISIIIKIKIKQIPKGIQNFFEFVIEGAESLCDQVTGDRKITNKAFPIVFTIFLFVLLNNWLGMFPFGGFGLIENGEHGKMFIPIIRSGTADINGTLPLAILSVLGANIFGILSIGLWKTINKFINLNALGSIFTKIKKDPMILMTAPIMFAVGFLELIGEFAKIASLSFRLFGNVFAGEVLLASMGAMLAYILPTPFLLLEVFVGVIQAFIFAILTLVYYTIASQDHEHEEHQEKHQENKHELEGAH